MAVQVGDPGRNWMAIVSLVLGVLSLCLGWTFILPLVGAILGYMGMSSNSRTMAIIGLVLNVLALVGNIVFVFFFGGLAALTAMTPS